jgi:hypothetical protein
VDETLAHHHTQIKCAIEQASKSFGVEAHKIISKLGNHVGSMGNYIFESKTERHQDVLNNIAHIGFPVVQTRAAVGALHKHLHNTIVLVAAGFHVVAEDNKKHDEQFKARFNFTECTAILLLLFALELAPSKISPIFCSVTFHLYLTEFLSSRLKSGTNGDTVIIVQLHMCSPMA